MTSSALAATVPDAKIFRNGRQFGAWLGLTPRQHSSGGRTRLGHISLTIRRSLKSAFAPLSACSPGRKNSAVCCCASNASVGPGHAVH
ncbi:transposase [Paraburkholderia sp. 40]|uniref:transposase n=1 Tax=Paraburkholderia sp. 40 TaxID=2991059 RepID=UPI003D1B3ECD